MNEPKKVEPIQILLVEDNPGDVFLAKEALKESKMYSHLTVMIDGQEAMDYLNQKGNYTDAVRPDLILLDLNLPKKTGYEVLEEIKEDDSLRLIPVVILTSSDNEADIAKTYSLHANSYITKPVDLTQFIKIVDSIDDFWFAVVKLPKAFRKY